MSRYAVLLLPAALAAGCAGHPVDPLPPRLEYSAVQVIETVPGPFRNTLYVAADRERQDASLGGTTVTTIVRRDKGVAWLLIPGQQQYEEVPLEGAEIPSVHARFDGLEPRSLGPDLLDGVRTEKVAYFEPGGRQVATAWLDANGIPLQSEFLEDALAGKPTAVIRLIEVQAGAQDAQLFELPPGYTRR